MGILDQWMRGQPSGGLLDPMSYNPRQEMMLAIAGQLLDNAAPSNMPRGMMQGVPQAVLGSRQNSLQNRLRQLQFSDLEAQRSERERQKEARTKFGAMTQPTYGRSAADQPWQQVPGAGDADLLGAFTDAYPDTAAKGFGGLLFPEEKVVPEGAQLMRGGEVLGRNPPKPTGSPFQGNAMDAQALSLIYQYETKRGAGAPTTPQEDYAYNLAKWQITQPRIVGTPEAGFSQVTPPPLPAFGGPQTPPPPPQAVPPAPIGTVQPITPPNRQPTQEQSTAAGFASRMAAAQASLVGIDTVGTSLRGRGLAAVPGGLGNYFQSAAYQKYQRAKTDFINAQLRRESGATIRDEEFLSAEKQYFPLPGDGPEVIEEKRKARDLAIANMAQSAGPANRGQPDFGGFEVIDVRP